MKINNKQSYGFTLVELMLAMVIGLIVIGGAFSMHSTARNTQYATEMQMDMVADARFAIELIAYDLRHAGSWGATNKASLVECRTSDPSCPTIPTAVSGDCATGWAYDLSTPVFGTNDSNPYAGTCIKPGEKYLALTDVLDIRYADANPPTLPLKSGQAYIRSNFINGRVFVGTAVPELDSYDTSPLTKNHELHAYAYYVSSFTDDDTAAGIPSLRRAALVGGSAMQNQLLVSGVEDFQVQFGIDTTTGTGQIINRYVNANTITDWTKVYAAKIWLLMRSDKKQKPGVGKLQKFSMAGVEKSYGGPGGFRYFMVSSVVNLRNAKLQ